MTRVGEWPPPTPRTCDRRRQLPAGPLAFRPPIGVPDIRARGRQRRISDDECDDGSIAPGEQGRAVAAVDRRGGAACDRGRSEEHTSELQSLMRISYAVFCLKKTKTT